MIEMEDRTLYSQWQDNQLEYFINSCPCRVTCYLFPEEEYFKNRLDVNYSTVLSRFSIPTDYIGLSQMDNELWSEILGFDLEQKEFCDCLGNLKFDVVNGIMRPRDLKTKYINCIEGHRVTSYLKGSSNRKIYVFGACNVFGLFCDDKKTICSYMQRYLNESHIEGHVVNCGIWGSENIYSALFSERIRHSDEVIIILTNYHGDKEKLKRITSVYDLVTAFDSIKNIEMSLVNNYAHHNYKVNEAIALQIFKDIFVNNCKGKIEAKAKDIIIPKSYFVGWNVYSYYYHFFMEYVSAINEISNVGCIVMNCNPVTLGHQALVEYASKEVEALIVFVVEEDLSYFKFTDRYAYAKKAFSKFNNVIVIPSGMYCISVFTFPDYFEREQIKESFDVEYDLGIFAEVIAPIFHIKKRFVGEEPFSKVTRAYNISMKKILTSYGIEVIEIERIKKGDTVISASLVRKLLSEGNTEAAYQYIPVEVRDVF